MVYPFEAIAEISCFVAGHAFPNKRKFAKSDLHNSTAPQGDYLPKVILCRDSSTPKLTSFPLKMTVGVDAIRIAFKFNI